jgi:hypothetical protein
MISDGPRSCQLQFFNPHGTAYFTSEVYDVENTMSSQIFSLHPPALFLGGEVRLVMRGMHQRQTLGKSISSV